MAVATNRANDLVETNVETQRGTYRCGKESERKKTSHKEINNN